MISLLLGSFLSTAQAVPMQLSQQGRLVDSSGVAAAGNHNLTFRLYNAGTGGTLLWNETVSTNFTNGYYSVVLGSDTINNPLEDSVLESGDLYIEIEIDSDGPLTPRSAVTSAPFARVAGKAQVADSVDWSGLTSVPSGLDDADTRLAALEALMTTVQSDLATANTTISTLQSDLATTQSDLATAQSDLATAQSDLATTQGDLATANSTIASLQSSVGTNTTDIASNASDITGLDTDLTTAEGNITSLQASVTTNTTDIASLQSDVTTLQGSVLDLIDTDTTWNIGSNGDYSTLEDAMAAAKSVRVHPDATLTLQLENNIYTVSEEINLNHPDGANIVIQGNSADPALVQLEFAGTNGFYIDSGHVFGGIDHLTIRGDSSNYGIFIDDGSLVYASNIVVETFYDGSYVRNNSILRIKGDSSFSDNADDGIELQYGSTLFTNDVITAINNNDRGVYAAGNSSIRVRNGNFQSNYQGIYVLHSSFVDSEGSNVSNNIHDGVNVRWGSSGHLNNMTANGVGHDAVYIRYNSVAHASGVEASNNTYTGFVVYSNSLLYADNSTANNNAFYGFLAGRNSSLFLANGVANNNTRYGFEIRDNSNFADNSISTSGNGWGGTNYNSSAYIE